MGPGRSWQPPGRAGARPPPAGRPWTAAWAAASGAVLSLAACSAAKVAEFTPYPAAEVAGVKNPHDYLGKPLCQSCHVPGDGLKAEPVAVCGHCHDVGHMNHPMAVPMKEKPEGLPLWNGTIACHTCHDPHDVKRNRSGLRFTGKDLCLRCHVSHRAPPGHGAGKNPS